MRTRLALCLLAVLASAGCHKPKDTCEGSFNSYFNAMKGKDWSAMYALLTPKYKKKARSPEFFSSFIQEEWGPAKNFDLNVMGIVPSGDLCIVNGTMDYTIKIRGKEPVDYDDEYFSWTFRRERDGLWYIELPGEEKLTGF
jgi:ketosteroid isomerase-like protein